MLICMALVEVEGVGGWMSFCPVSSSALAAHPSVSDQGEPVLEPSR